MKIYQGIVCLVMALLLLAFGACLPALGLFITGIVFLINVAQDFEKELKANNDKDALENHSKEISKFIASGKTVKEICDAFHDKLKLDPVNVIKYLYQEFFLTIQEKLINEINNKSYGETSSYLENISLDFIDDSQDLKYHLNNIDLSENVIFFSPTMKGAQISLEGKKRLHGYVLLTTSTLIFIPAKLDMDYFKQNDLYKEYLNKFSRFAPSPAKVGIALNKFHSAVSREILPIEKLTHQLKDELKPQIDHPNSIAIPIVDINSMKTGNLYNQLFSKYIKVESDTNSLEIRSSSFPKEIDELRDLLIYTCLLNNNPLLNFGSKFKPELFSYPNLVLKSIEYEEFKIRVLESLKSGVYKSPFQNEEE